MDAIKKALRQEAGMALLTLLAFIGLTVPLALGAIVISGQLNLYSRIYNKILRGHYSASAGAEWAFWQVVSNSNFTDGLTPTSPCSDTIVTFNGQPITVTVCRIFSSTQMAGQAIVVTKNVTPTTADPGVPTTFTYNINLRNEGSGDVDIKAIYDYLPPKFTYENGSTGGLTTREPSANNSSPLSCGVKPYQLYWNVSPDGMTLSPGQELNLTFQASGTLSQGTYLNQASVRYVPWWTSNTVDVYTPFTAPVIVGNGSPYCGYDLNVMVTKTVQPTTTTPGVEEEFTYTISAENLSSSTRYICDIDDKLPPTFTYVAGSAGSYPTNIDTEEPQLTWDSASTRWIATWKRGQGSNLDPMVSLQAGETRTQSFKAKTTPEPGVDYFNEVNAVWSKQLVGGHCKTGSGDGGSSTYGGSVEGGASQSSEVSTLVLYDITAYSADGTVQSRIQYSEVNGQITILSWNEY